MLGVLEFLGDCVYKVCVQVDVRMCVYMLAPWAGEQGWWQWPHSQLLVSLATAMMPMGCWGMSTRSSFMSLPTYLLARCTARRTQSVQKMCSPYTASPKGWTGSDFRITCGTSTRPITGGLRSPAPTPPHGSWPQGRGLLALAQIPGCSWEGEGPTETSCLFLPKPMRKPSLDRMGAARGHTAKGPCHCLILPPDLPTLQPDLLPGQSLSWLTRCPLSPAHLEPHSAGPPTHIAVRAVILAPLDLVQGGVGEVELLGPVVNGQAVGSTDVLLDESQDVGSRQGCPHDAGVLLVPVGPEHQARGREGPGGQESNPGSLPQRARSRAKS